jgi:hypothetical protein
VILYLFIFVLPSAVLCPVLLPSALTNLQTRREKLNKKKKNCREWRSMESGLFSPLASNAIGDPYVDRSSFPSFTLSFTFADFETQAMGQRRG